MKPILAEDVRAMAGRQSFVKDAPVNLIYVADFSKTGTATNEEKEFYSAADTGFISQNVYLYCASEGLATVVRGHIDRPALAKSNEAAAGSEGHSCAISRIFKKVVILNSTG